MEKPKFNVGNTAWSILHKRNLIMKHTIYFSNSNDLSNISNKSVDVVITSPPYPMIKMWDEIMGKQNPKITESLKYNPELAFELMHIELDKVWKECYRVLKEGGFMCINIGDATRTIGEEFRLYNNHSRIVYSCTELGFVNLPNIIWRKQTNAPNKFMGSGMLPCGAYVTLEHEWILVFRKGGKRNHKKEEDKTIRRESSFFWEERNKWFSDVWDIKGAKQKINNPKTRERNGSFPIEIPYRLINMFSQKGDIVLDPFMGIGTTAVASILSERNSIGFEIDLSLKPLIKDVLKTANNANSLIFERYKNHLAFVDDRIKQKKDVKYDNFHLGTKVMTSQETDLELHYINDINLVSENEKLEFESTYFLDRPLSDFPISK